MAKFETIHDVYNADPRFVINPVTRVVKNESSKKTKLTQFDHNSEIFGFEIPRYIEGHDMSLCDKVEVQYINIDSETKKENKGFYRVKDLQVNTEDENSVVFSWLISENATQLVGLLAFLIMFECEDSGEVVYRWSTSINKDIYISDGMDNGSVIAENYVDVLLEWENKLFNTVRSAYNIAVENGFKGTEQEWLESLKGKSFEYDDFTEEQIEALKSGVKSLEIKEALGFTPASEESVAVERERINQFLKSVDVTGSGYDEVEVDSYNLRYSVFSNGVVGVVTGEIKTIEPNEIIDLELELTNDQVDKFKPLFQFFPFNCDQLVIRFEYKNEYETDYLNIRVFNQSEEKHIIKNFSFVYPLEKTTFTVQVPELVDIRVGYDGTVYSNAGEAVRQQIEKAMQSGGGSVTDEQITQAVEAYFAENGVPNYTPVRRTTVVIYADKWVEEEENKYSQVVTINGVTANTDVELKLSDEQVIAFNEKNVAFLSKNVGGVVTVYAFGQKPQNDYTLQVILTEVVEV